MSDTCPTVTIRTEDGPVIINDSDFDPKVHTLHVAGEAPAAAETDLDGMTAAELRAYIEANGGTAPSNAKKAELFDVAKALAAS
jgi:hypothetical protein